MCILRPKDEILDNKSSFQLMLMIHVADSSISRELDCRKSKLIYHIWFDSYLRCPWRSGIGFHPFSDIIKTSYSILGPCKVSRSRASGRAPVEDIEMEIVGIKEHTNQ